MEASTQVSTLQAKFVLRRRFVKVFLYLFLRKNSTQPPTPNIVNPIFLQGSWFKNTWIYTTWAYFSGQMVFEKIKKIKCNNFSIFIISPWKRELLFISSNLNFLYLRMHWLTLAKWFLRRSWKCKIITDRLTAYDKMW